jgi:predicted GNAT superfamily acetyltransferase
MASAQRVGGLILGAFDQDEHLIGFAFAYLGRLEGRLILWSQLTGVHPAHQSTGVGRVLKFEQRRRAREMGLAAVAWAFDPLQASNASFNLGVLGATCRDYEVDMYGSRSDALNAGTATDRLVAEWETSGEPTGLTMPWADTIDLIRTARAGASGFDRVQEVQQIPAGARHLAIETPANLMRVKSQGGMVVISDWQLAVRRSFQAAFNEGFVTVGFTRQDREHPRYLLERRP